jgi:type I restriction enzyme S subunit
VARIYAGGTPDRETDSYWEDGDIPWLNSGEVNQGIITEPSTYITKAGFRGSSAKWIPSGALVIALAGQGKTKGMVAQLGFDSTCNQSMAAIVPSRLLVPRFLLWWMSAHYETIRNLAGGDLRDGLNLDIVGDIPCPVPPLVTQRAIADFLDRETARIDALLAATQRMLALLETRLQVYIDSALRSALHSEVPLRRLLAEPPTYGAAESGEYGDAQWPRYIRITDLADDGSLRDNDVRRLAPLIAQRYLLREGDVLIARSGATVGKAFIYQSAMGPACFAGYLIRFRFRADVVLPEMVELWTRTAHYWGQVAASSLQATIQNLNADRYKDLLFPLPERDQQVALIEHIEKKRSQFRIGRDLIERQLSLLRGRKQSLITAAVTGELDIPEVPV